jgi:hypothetical protein
MNTYEECDEYGEYTVPVDEDGCRSERPLREIIDIWEGRDGSPGNDQGDKLYVKDWHLAMQLERERARAGLSAWSNTKLLGFRRSTGSLLFLYTLCIGFW